MTIVNTSPGRIIQLGYEGEDRVTVLRFRYSADWLENGEGIFRIRVRRHGETQAYNAQLVADDAENNCLLMTVTDVELSVKSSGEMQVVYSGADFVKKSPIYSYNVSRAVDEAVDPPAQDVYTQIIESLSDLQTDVQGLSDAVDGIGNLADLTTTAKTDLVSAINEINEHGGASVTVDDELSDVSTNPVQNKVITSRIASAESAIQGKADIQTVTTLSDTVADLQTELAEKVGDVQVNGISVVADGVANVPVAGSSTVGVVKTEASQGLVVNNAGLLTVSQASSNYIKGGTRTNNPITPVRQHEAVFYGLAKVAGHDEKNSTLVVGTYTEDAKTAIRTMLGLQDVYDDYSSALEALGGDE